MPKMIHVKFTRLGRREARLLRKERELEARLLLKEKELEARFAAKEKALEMERWAAEEARLKHEQAALKYEVKRRWAEYDRRKDPEIKEEIGRIIQQAHEEGIELASP